MSQNPLDKPFSWSYSKLKNFEVCPKRHLHMDILKDFKEGESQALLWGNQLHDAMAAAIGTDDNKQRHPRDWIEEAPLPDQMSLYQPWVDRIRAARGAGSRVLAESSYAITKDFQPAHWMAGNAWFRTKVDAMVIAKGNEYAVAWDWKTGKRLDDSVQLMLTAMCVMIHNPSVKAVRTEFVWLNEMLPARPFGCVDRVAFTRAQIPEIWNKVAGRVAVVQKAHVEQNYPPKPGHLCRKWCAVRTCEHHGK